MDAVSLALEELKSLNPDKKKLIVLKLQKKIMVLTR